MCTLSAHHLLNHSQDWSACFRFWASVLLHEPFHLSSGLLPSFYLGRTYLCCRAEEGSGGLAAGSGRAEASKQGSAGNCTCCSAANPGGPPPHRPAASGCASQGLSASVHQGTWDCPPLPCIHLCFQQHTKLQQTAGLYVKAVSPITINAILCRAEKSFCVVTA